MKMVASLTKLKKQCGVSYRESENFMFNTGSQPFVVDIRLDR